MTQEQAREKLARAQREGVTGAELELLRQALFGEWWGRLQDDWERCGDPIEVEE